MKRLKLLPLILLCLSVLACKTSQTAVSEEELVELKNLLEQQSFKIDVTVVYPFNTAATLQVLNNLLPANTGNTANRIDVRGDGFYLKSTKETFEAILPYFGERRMSGTSYNSDGRIEFNTTKSNYEIKKHEKHNAFVVSFKANDKNQITESYDISLVVYNTKNVDININSSHRQSIRYSGVLKAY